MQPPVGFCGVRYDPSSRSALRGHVESYFIKANNPSLRRALWLKAGPVINLDLRANPERLAKGDAIRFHADVRRAIEAGDGAAAQAGIAADIQGAADFILSRGGLDRAFSG